MLTILKFQNVFYSHENKVIIDNLSIEVGEGYFIYIVVPSGSGKSTF